MPRASAVARAGRPSAPPGWAARVLALLEVARWENALIAAAGVALGAWWAAGAVTAATGWAAVAAVGLAALANAFNDVHDADIDAVAHPDRPIPSQRVTPREAAGLALAGATAAVVAAALVSPALSWATVGVAGAMISYTLWLKPRGAVGNVAVALIASLPFVYGAWSVGAPGGAALLYTLAVPLHLAREIAKDLDDAVGDAPHRRTVPVALGAVRARSLLAAVSVVFACVATAAFVRGGLAAVALLVPALGCCAAAVVRARAGGVGAPRLLKAAMLLAMGAAFTARAGRLI